MLGVTTEKMAHDVVDLHLIFRHSSFYITWCQLLYWSFPAEFDHCGSTMYYQESRTTTHSWPTFFFFPSRKWQQWKTQAQLELIAARQPAPAFVPQHLSLWWGQANCAHHKPAFVSCSQTFTY